MRVSRIPTGHNHSLLMGGYHLHPQILNYLSNLCDSVFINGKYVWIYGTNVDFVIYALK